ncbi:MAG: glycosyltransferase family 2 protein [Methanomicrobia archaeon]|nr:glycosyltransferase family 2 protein [Methanomicrobia archaeon]
MKRVAVIVPVAEFEDVNVVLKSAQHLSSLDRGELEMKIIYAVDLAGPDDGRVTLLKQEGMSVFTRKRRGKRAGAVNDTLEYLSDFNPDYIALFDIDSRPEPNFVVICVEALEADHTAYIASSRRYISNHTNLVSQTIQAEYFLLNFLLKKSGFKQFNGLIGVLRADLLAQYKLKEEAIAEDADYATRMYARGYQAILVQGTQLYEQAPVRWRDLLNQRLRWHYGGLQLWRYWHDVKRCGNKKFIRSWLLALTLNYAVIIYLPLSILTPFVLLGYPAERLPAKVLPKPPLRITVGLILHLFLLQYSAIVAIVNYLRGRGVEWTAIKRVAD